MRFQPVLLLLLHVLVVRVLTLLMSCCHVVSCRSSGSRVRNCKLFNEGTCPRQSSMQQKAWLILPVVICLSHWLSCSKKEFEVRFLPGPPNSPEPRRVQPTKKWPRKKKKTTTTDHGGRGRRRPGSHGGGWSRRAELAARPTRCSRARTGS